MLSLAAEETAVVSSVCTLPPEVAGDVTLRAFVDRGDSVFETDEGEHRVLDASAIGVAEPNFDLGTGAFGCGAGITVAVGSTENFSYVVRNPATANGGPYSVSVFLSEDAIITLSDLLVRTLAIAASATAGTENGISFSCEVPSASADTPYFVGASLDPDDEIPGTDETNNVGLEAGGVPRTITGSDG